MTRAKKSTSKSAKLATRLFIKPKSIKPQESKPLPKFEDLPGLDRKQCKKAVDALVGYMKKKISESEKTDLLAGEENEDVWLGVTLKQMSPKDNHKPQRIPLSHPLMDPRRNPVCLIVKDPQREYKDLLEEKKIKFISRVVGMEKLQGKFKPYEARRQLMKEHDLFLVDDRIVPEMPRILGRSWLEAKKSPIPVTLKRADLKAELERAISSTYLRINKGTSVSVKVATLDVHSPSGILDNLCSIIPYLDTKLPMGGWDNVQSMYIKTTSSTSLPIWSCDLGDGESSKGRFFVADVNQEEVEAKKKAKEEKDKRIRDKKERRILNKLIRAGPSSSEDEDEDDEEAVDDDGDEDDESVEEADVSAAVEPIDETPAKDTPKKKALSTRVASKPSASPAGGDRKTVSSTSKKVKGMDAVKGLPTKVKSKKVKA